MSAYDALAGSYDALLADGAHRRRADALDRRFRRSRPPVETVLDLGCGTGTIACLLAARGYRVVAVDGSEDMLAQAARKAEGLDRPPLFLHQDMSRLRLGMTVDAAVSTLDALNYLTTERALGETFRRVFRWLRPGGAFWFDVNTPAKFRRMDGQAYLDETEETFCAWRTFFSERSGICTYQVDLFRLRPDGTWERRFEEHRERAWTEEQLRRLLTEAGFAGITVTGDLSPRPPKADADRWNFRAVRTT